MANSTQLVFIEALSAAVGGVFSSSALFPLELIKTQAQAQGSPAQSSSSPSSPSSSPTPPQPPTTLQIATRIYTNEGILGFWKDFQYSALQSSVEKGIYFLAYSFLKTVYTSVLGPPATLPSLALGCAGEWAHLPVSMPLDVLTTRLQTRDDQTKNETAFVLMSQIIEEKGVGGLYKGIEAYTVLCFKPAIQYTIYEYVKKMVLAGRSVGRKQRGEATHAEQNLSAVEVFLLGMLARAVSTVVCFPYTRAKVMMQTKNKAKEMLKIMYEEDGLKSMFQGLGPELSRGVLSAAIMLMIKEKINERILRAFR